MQTSHVPVAAILPIALIVLAFQLYCVVDVWRSPRVRFVPKWGWTLICLFGGLVGSVAYLLVGREPR